MNLNAKQIISIIGAILSVLMIATTQLTDLFGVGVAKTIVSAAGLGNLIIQSVMTALTSNFSAVKDAGNTQGVEVQVSRSASAAIAGLAVDPAQGGISPAPGETAAVAKKAEGTTP